MKRHRGSWSVCWLILVPVFTWLLPGVDDVHSAPAASDAIGVCRGWRVDRDLRVTADLNNDRRADIVAFGDAGVWTALANIDGTFALSHLTIRDFGSEQGWDVSKHVRLLADLNNDGRADIVAFGNDGVWTALSNGDGTFAPPRLVLGDFGFNQGWIPSKHVRYLADLNSDGSSDIIGFGNDGVWTALSNGDGTFAPHRLVLGDFGFNQGWTPSKHERLLADLNNDGKADIIAFGDAGVWTALSNGDGTFAPHRLVLGDFGSNQGWMPSKHVRLVANITNDRRADIVAFGDAGVWTAISNGDGTFTPHRLVLGDLGSNQGWSRSKHVRLLANVTNDQRADIIAFGDAGVWTAVSNGDGTFATHRLVLGDFGSDQGWSPAKHVRLLANLSRDDRADIVAFGDAGVWTALANRDGTFASPRLLTDEFACNGKFDFNLEWTVVDIGGFPLNPRWRWQRENPGIPNAVLCHYFSKTVLVRVPGGGSLPIKVPDFADCTNQTSMDNVDTPDGFNAFKFAVWNRARGSTDTSIGSSRPSKEA